MWTRSLISKKISFRVQTLSTCLLSGGCCLIRREVLMYLKEGVDVFKRVLLYHHSKIKSEIFNCIKNLYSLDWLCRFLIFSKKIIRWLINWLIEKIIFSKNNFNNDLDEFCRVFDRIVKFELIWLIRERFLLERNLLFFVWRFRFRFRRLRFFFFWMSADFWNKFNDICLFMIIDFMRTHSWFIEY